MVLLTILAVLFLALFIVIPLIEKHGSRDSEKIDKLSRYILPLMLALAAVSTIAYFVRG